MGDRPALLQPGIHGQTQAKHAFRASGTGRSEHRLTRVHLRRPEPSLHHVLGHDHSAWTREDARAGADGRNGDEHPENGEGTSLARPGWGQVESRLHGRPSETTENRWRTTTSVTGFSTGPHSLPVPPHSPALVLVTAYWMCPSAGGAKHVLVVICHMVLVSGRRLQCRGP